MYIEHHHGPQARSGREHTSNRPRIVVADHDTDSWTGTDLVAARYDVTLAADARRAVELARRRGADCVVAEFPAPGAAAPFDLVAELRRDDRTRDVPVILLAAGPGRAPAFDALRRGADDCVVRPCPPGELVARIERQLRSRRDREAAVAERRRLADLVHNELQQLLVAASLRLDLASGARDEAVRLREMATVRDILALARTATQDLTRRLRSPGD
jgi:DNA-binding response OmpR family regulator